MKNFDVRMTIDGKDVGGTTITVDKGILFTDNLEDEFYAIIRKNAKSLIEQAEGEECAKIIDDLTHEQEKKLEAVFMEDYHGSKDNFEDSFENWLMDLPLAVLKKVVHG